MTSEIRKYLGDEAASAICDEVRRQRTDLGLDNWRDRRAAFSARTRDAIQRETHVIVGDHPPEPRSTPGPLSGITRIAASDAPRWPCPARLHNPAEPYDPNLNPG